MELSKRKRFITNIVYWAIILAIVYLIFRYLLNLLMPFVIALAVAWLLRPLSKLYKRKLRRHTRVASALTVATVLLFYLIIGGLLILVFASVASDVADYLTMLPTAYTQTIEPGLRELYMNAQEFASRFDPSVVELINNVLPELISSVSSAVTSFSVGAVTTLTGVATRLPSFLLAGVICIISTIFMATSFDEIKRFLSVNLPARVSRVAGYVTTSFQNVIMQYGKSYLLIMLMTFAELSIGLFIIGTKNALLIAALIAVLDIFPIVGAGLILVPWTVITFIQGKLLQGIGLAVLWIVTIIVRQIAEPRIVGKHVGLPPLVTLACMFVGSSLFGGLGLLGLPILAAIITNLSNDPDVPITIFRNAPPEDAAECAPETPKSGKTTYSFKGAHKKGEAPPQDGAPADNTKNPKK